MKFVITNVPQNPDDDNDDDKYACLKQPNSAIEQPFI